MNNHYTKKIHELRQNSDPQAVLDFLQGIFCDPGNQKIRGSASDYLYDNDEDRGYMDSESNVAPKVGFEDVLANFQPQKTVQEHVNEIVSSLQPSEIDPDADEQTQRNQQERQDLLDLFRPLNAIQLYVGDYERCDALARSGFYSTQTERFEKFYDLYHYVVEPQDSEENYDFVYELENGDQYNIKYQEKKIPGKELYYDLKVTLFSCYFMQVIEALKQSAEFAAIKKTLPFYFLIQSADYRDQEWCYTLAVIDEEALQANPLREQFLAARPKVGEPSVDQQYVFYSTYYDQPETDEFKQLAGLLKQYPKYFQEAREELQSALQEDEPGRVVDFARLLWETVDTYESDVLALQKQIFAQPLPSLDPDSDDDPAYVHRTKSVLDIVNEKVTRFVRMLRQCKEAAPERYQSTITEYCNNAMTRLRGHENAAVRVLAFEVNLSEEDFDGDVPANPTEQYVNDVVACIDLLGPVPESHWATPAFVADRLTGLGERAAGGIRALFEKIEERNSASLNTGDVRTLAAALYQMGCVEVPDAVHRTHEDNEFTIEEYGKWIRRGPEQAWVKLEQAIEENSECFNGTAAWEEYLYDSDKGYQIFAEKLRAKDYDKIAVAAASAMPAGPHLSRQLYELAHAIQHSKGPNKDYAQALAYLELIPAPDEKAQDFLLWARIAVGLYAVENNLPDAEKILQTLCREYPDNAMALFWRVNREIRYGDLSKGMKIMSDGLHKVVKDDLVYRKALEEFTETELPEPRSGQSYSIDANQLYPIYKVANQYVQDRCFTRGQFDGIRKNFQEDPFYWGIYSRLDGPQEEVSRLLQIYRDEWNFLTTSAHLSDEELIAKLDPANWSIFMSIARQFVDEPGDARLQALADHFGQLHDDDQRRDLSFLLWPVAKDQLLRNEAFHHYLSEFVRRYPESGDTLARGIVSNLQKAGLDSVARDLAVDLNAEVVLNISLTLFPLFLSANEHQRLVDLFIRCSDDISKLKPEWTLALNNAAVVYVRMMDYQKAQSILDILFSQDIDRFREGEDDDISKAIMDETVASSTARTFWRYWAMANFNQACLYSLTGKYDQAMENLTNAAKFGPYEADYFLAEEDLVPLRQREDFRNLLETMQGETA
jgi:hypothetical protein